MLNSFSAGVSKQFKGGRAVFKINGAGTTGDAHVKVGHWTPISQRMQKLIHDDLSECKI